MVPKLHEQMFNKQVEHLVLMGVLKNSTEEEWGSPSFPHSKPKTDKVHFLSDFRGLNEQLKCKPYPIPIINKMIIKLEGFKNYTSLDLNLGCYYI